MTIPLTLKAIQSSGLGRFVGKELAQTVARAGEIQQWPKKSLLFQEGDDVRGMYIVLKGIVKLTKNHPDGSETLLHLAQPSDTFAEAGLFLNYYPATAVTDSSCELLLLRRNTVLELINAHPVFARYLFDRIAKWLEQLVTQIDELTCNDATARVVRYLLSLHEAQQKKTHQKTALVNLPIKKATLPHT